MRLVLIMLKYAPRRYQKQSAQFLRDNPFCGLFLDMGLGKTIVTLTVIKEQLVKLNVLKVLVIAPKLVASHTWPAELSKWEHLKRLKCSVIMGDEPSRIAALRRNADIYTINREMLVWLVEYYGVRKWPFDYIIVDESSSFKNHRAKRTRALYHVVKRLKGMVLLSGTPAPNGLIDLWAQIHLLDGGKRLYPNITTFRNEYFYQNKDGFGWSPRKKAESEIFEAISDICLCIKSEGYIELPDRIDIIKEIELDDYTEYRKFKRERVLELPEGEITAYNASALYTKLLQYANGAVYDADRKYHTVNNAKLDALEEIVEELQGRPLLIAYQFQSDIERIMRRIPQTVLLTSDRQIDDWNKGRIPVLLAHAASKSEGLNLQDGGNYLAWFGIPASMQQYWQFIKRLHRSGQTQKVFNILLMIKGTPERKVYNGLLDKTLTNDRLFEALRKDDYRADPGASRQWL
jgi:SNF2 family DNA or RNA helicase